MNLIGRPDRAMVCQSACDTARQLGGGRCRRNVEGVEEAGRCAFQVAQLAEIVPAQAAYAAHAYPPGIASMLWSFPVTIAASVVKVNGGGQTHQVQPRLSRAS
jgi:hypothetical protein